MYHMSPGKKRRGKPILEWKSTIKQARADMPKIEGIHDS